MLKSTSSYKPRTEYRYAVSHTSDLGSGTATVGYPAPITDQERAELPALIGQEYGLDDVEVLEVVAL